VIFFTNLRLFSIHRCFLITGDVLITNHFLITGDFLITVHRNHNRWFQSPPPPVNCNHRTALHPGITNIPRETYRRGFLLPPILLPPLVISSSGQLILQMLVVKLGNKKMSVCPSVRPSVCLSVRPSVCVCLSVRLSVCLSVFRLFVWPSVRLCVCLSVCLSVCLYLPVSVSAKSHGRKGKPIELKL